MTDAMLKKSSRETFDPQMPLLLKDIELPRAAEARMETFEPNAARPKTENDEPNRTAARIETFEPRHVQSNKEQELPYVIFENTDIVLPS
jgi:hypothetical protein